MNGTLIYPAELKLTLRGFEKFNEATVVETDAPLKSDPLFPNPDESAAVEPLVSSSFQ